MKGKDSNDKNIVADWEPLLLAKIKPDGEEDDGNDKNMAADGEAFLFAQERPLLEFGLKFQLVRMTMLMKVKKMLVTYMGVTKTRRTSKRQRISRAG